MLKKVRSQSKQRGIGLLELMLSLSIIAILLVMATRYFVIANENQKINNALSMVNGYAGGAAQYATVNHSYSAMTTKALVDGNYLPNVFGGSDGFGAGANPWGGDMTTKEVTNTSFKVLITGIPQLADQTPNTCTKLLGVINSSIKGLATGCGGEGTGTITVTFN